MSGLASALRRCSWELFDILKEAAGPFGLLPAVALSSFMTRAFSLFVIGLGLSLFKTLATALSMSFSSPGWRTRSPRLPSKPSCALSLESPVGTIELPSAATGLGFSAARTQSWTAAALDTPSIAATSLPAMPDRTNETAWALGSGS